MHSVDTLLLTQDKELANMMIDHHTLVSDYFQKTGKKENLKVFKKKHYCKSSFFKNVMFMYVSNLTQTQVHNFKMFLLKTFYQEIKIVQMILHQQVFQNEVQQK